MDSKDTAFLLRNGKGKATGGQQQYTRRESRELINDTLDSASPPTNRNLNTSKSFSNNSKQRINLLSADVQTDNQTVTSKDNTTNLQEDPWNSKEVWMNINDIYFEKNVLDGLKENGATEHELAPRFCRPEEQASEYFAPNQGKNLVGTSARGVLRDIKVVQANRSPGED